MTTVNDFVDILRIIREQPEWADALRGALLSKEVLELPLRLAEFAEATNRRLGTLESDVGQLKEGQARLEEGQVRLEGKVTRLEEGQVRLEGRVTRLEEGQVRLEGRVTRLEEGQSRLESGQSRLEGAVGTFGEQHTSRRCEQYSNDRPQATGAPSRPAAKGLRCDRRHEIS